MKTKLFKTLCCTLALCFVLAVMAGCSNSGASSSAAPEASSGAAEASSSEETAGSGEQIVITVGAHVANPEEQEPGYYNVFKNFDEAHDNITIEIIGTDTDNHIKNMKMAARERNVDHVLAGRCFDGFRRH